ncbi:MAG: hypothetical protein QOG02_513 [Gaiellales bacterium]|nr:hypothetical protein [Gaiellales bacterium]
MLQETVIDPALTSDAPSVSPAHVVLATELLLTAAEEVCIVAERLKGLDVSDGGVEQGSPETLVATEQIARAIAWLNEAQGALLFG